MRVEWTTSELKETLLLMQAVFWGAVLLFPGNSFASSSQVDMLSSYAPDFVWGVVLIAVNAPLVFLGRYRYKRYRRFVHVFDWTFWLAITCIAIYRSAPNGINAVDILLVMPFLTIALLHGIIYAGLEKPL